MSEIQNTLDVVNGRLDFEEIGELEDVVIETIHNETERKIFFLKSGESISELWGNFKWPNMRVIGVP